MACIIVTVSQHLACNYVVTQNFLKIEGGFLRLDCVRPKNVVWCMWLCCVWMVSFNLGGIFEILIKE